MIRKLIIISICAVLAFSFSACALPALKTQSAQTQAQVQTQEPQAEDAGIIKPDEALWTIIINESDYSSVDLAGVLESIYLRVGCTPCDGYLFSGIAGFIDTEDIAKVKIVFEDGSFLTIDSQAAFKDTTLLVIAIDSEPLSKPLLGYEELVYMSPVAEISFMQ